MRKLSLPFKKLSAAEISFFLRINFLTALLTACSGQMSDVGGNIQDGHQSTDRSPIISLSSPIKGTWLEIRSSALPEVISPVRINAKACVDKKFAISTTMQVLGQLYDIVFEEEAGALNLAIVEDTETKLSGLEISQELKDAVCADSKQFETAPIAIDNGLHAQLISTLSAAVTKMAPDCKTVTFEAKVAKCQLEQMYPQAALVKTEDFQKAMIRKWSRQPYILARRTGVVSTLARASTNFGNDEGFARFCRVLQFSLPEELPVVMTSRRWQNALCSGQSALRREAALYGLVKGVNELAMLRDLYEQTSREGLLSVRIPNQAIPGRALDAAKQPLRVIIAPEDEVSQHLVDEAKKFLGRPDQDEQPRRLSRRKVSRHKPRVERPVEVLAEASGGKERQDMCWHPVFAESWDLMRVADGMKLTGDGFQYECGYIYERDAAEGRELAGLSKYLLQSLSSETEFVLDNGQSKLLRLPEGRYRYTVHVLPANPLDSEEVDDDNAPKSSGELGWGTTRNHAIKAW